MFADAWSVTGERPQRAGLHPAARRPAPQRRGRRPGHPAGARLGRWRSPAAPHRAAAGRSGLQRLVLRPARPRRERRAERQLARHRRRHRGCRGVARAPARGHRALGGRGWHHPRAAGRTPGHRARRAGGAALQPRRGSAGLCPAAAGSGCGRQRHAGHAAGPGGAPHRPRQLAARRGAPARAAPGGARPEGPHHLVRRVERAGAALAWGAADGHRRARPRTHPERARRHRRDRPLRGRRRLAMWRSGPPERCVTARARA
jgi:hypothetical protein